MSIQEEEIKKLKEENELLKKRLDNANKLKSTFLANMSHEIRTPLNAIVGFSNFLTECEELTESERNEFINIIQQNNDYLLKIIDDILELSKIERDQVFINNVKLKLNQFLGGLINENKKKINPNRKVELILDDVDFIENCLIEVDAIKLEQILNNLIDNAIRFTLSGYVLVGYKQIPGFIEFYVEDSGVGIPKEKLEHVFNSFYQINSAICPDSGMGVGLFISKNYVKRMGGVMGVSSVEGEGSRFHFTIPYLV